MVPEIILNKKNVLKDLQSEKQKAATRKDQAIKQISPSGSFVFTSTLCKV
jgi:hypothetical protein